jgi:predicted metal-binding membrane protein
MQDAVPAGRHAATDRSRRVLVATLLVLAALAWTATIALARSPAAMSVMPAALAAGPAMRLQPQASPTRGDSARTHALPDSGHGAVIVSLCTQATERLHRAGSGLRLIGRREHRVVVGS